MKSGIYIGGHLFKTSIKLLLEGSIYFKVYESYY